MPVEPTIDVLISFFLNVNIFQILWQQSVFTTYSEDWTHCEGDKDFRVFAKDFFPRCSVSLRWIIGTDGELTLQCIDACSQGDSDETNTHCISSTEVWCCAVTLHSVEALLMRALPSAKQTHYYHTHTQDAAPELNEWFVNITLLQRNTCVCGLLLSVLHINQRRSIFYLTHCHTYSTYTQWKLLTCLQVFGILWVV